MEKDKPTSSFSTAVSSNGWLRFKGAVLKSFRLASGTAEKDEDKKFGLKGTLEWQEPAFEARGVPLRKLIPNLHIGTINVGINGEIELNRAYQGEKLVSVKDLEWDYIDLKGEKGTIKEDFHLIKCALLFNNMLYEGYLYYPDPLTKPPTNAHNYDRVEFLGPTVPNIAYGVEVEVLIPDEVFKLREAPTLTPKPPKL